MNAITLNMTAAPTAGDNSEGRLDKAKAHMGLLGKAEAMGQGSRRDAGVFLTQLAADGIAGEDDAEALYDAYLTSAGKTAARKNLAGVGENANSRTAQVSKFRTFIKLGLMPAIDGPMVLDRAIKIAVDVSAAGTKVLSPFEALRTVCTRQLEQPAEPLTDEQIVAAVSKPEPKEKDEIAKLVEDYKRMYKRAADMPHLPSIGAAVDAIADAIVEAGGEVPAMTKEDKAMAEAMAFLAKRGMVATFALPKP